MKKNMILAAVGAIFLTTPVLADADTQLNEETLAVMERLRAEGGAVQSVRGKICEEGYTLLNFACRDDEEATPPTVAAVPSPPVVRPVQPKTPPPVARVAPKVQPKAPPASKSCGSCTATFRHAVTGEEVTRRVIFSFE